MNKQEYLKAQQKLFIQINNLLDEAIKNTKQFKSLNDELTNYSLGGEIDRKIDTIIQKSTWIYDILEGNSLNISDKSYKRTLTKKLEKL